jgi:phenylacetic acid degradation operon negative regulatory protein
MRTTSLIVTLFGDVVSQHGNTIWLGSLVRAMAPMGINERLVRTSVFRLVQEGWLESERVGRRSFYRFTEYGTHEYQHAARRIYALENNQWRGRWQLLIPQDIPEDRREQFKRSLHWLGYRAIATGTYAKPGDGGQTLGETLEDFKVADKVIILDAQTAAISSPQLVRKLVHDNWQLEVVAQSYRDFIKRYKPLLNWAQRKQTPEAAFVARTLLIHDYRRILLNDTPLPDELLPSAWPGAKALELTGVVYKALAHSSVDYIYAELESGNGSMPKVDTQFWNRFERIG